MKYLMHGRRHTANSESYEHSRGRAIPHYHQQQYQQNDVGTDGNLGACGTLMERPCFLSVNSVTAKLVICHLAFSAP